MEETKKALNQVDDFSGPLIGTYKPFEIKALDPWLDQ